MVTEIPILSVTEDFSTYALLGENNEQIQYREILQLQGSILQQVTGS